jgi:hypothetical protein
MKNCQLKTCTRYHLRRYKKCAYCKISTVKHNSCIFIIMLQCFYIKHKNKKLINIIIKDTRVVFDGTNLTVFIANTQRDGHP